MVEENYIEDQCWGEGEEHKMEETGDRREVGMIQELARLQYFVGRTEW